MIGVTAIDIEVPGNGRSVRGAYLDWMKSSQVMRPIHAEQGKLAADPFGGPATLRTSEEDKEIYGTVTAPLTTETVPMGSSLQMRLLFNLDWSATARRSSHLRSGQPAGRGATGNLCEWRRSGPGFTCPARSGRSCLSRAFAFPPPDDEISVHRLGPSAEDRARLPVEGGDE